MEIKEWQSAAGVRFPHRAFNYQHGVKMADITAVEVKVNSGLDVRDLSRKPTKSAQQSCSMVLKKLEVANAGLNLLLRSRRIFLGMARAMAVSERKASDQ